MTTPTSTRTRRIAPWIVLFLAFPLSGLTAVTLLGPATTPLLGLIGGAFVGAVLGLAEKWALSRSWWWVLATSLGLGLGTAASTAAAGLSAFAVPLIAGAILGIAQAVSRPLLKPAIWAVVTMASWTAAWAVSLVIAVGDEPGHYVFGASGALLFCLVLFAATTLAPASWRSTVAPTTTTAPAPAEVPSGSAA